MDNLKGYIFGDSDTIMKTPDGGVINTISAIRLSNDLISVFF